MEYQAVKDRIDKFLNRFPFTRKIFYLLLDLFFLRQWYIKRILRDLLEKKKEATFFDAGAGFGQYSFYVLKRSSSSKILAVDYNETVIKNFYNSLNTRFKKRVEIGKADLQCYHPQQQYDIAIAIDILEHIEDDVAVLSNLKKSLTDDGVLILSTPYASTEAEFTAEHYRNGYTVEDLSLKLKKTGFKIMKLEHSYGFWGNISWYLIIKYPLSAIEKVPLLISLLPLYYLICYPLAALLMHLDLHTDNPSGKGLIVTATPLK